MRVKLVNVLFYVLTLIPNDRKFIINNYLLIYTYYIE